MRDIQNRTIQYPYFKIPTFRLIISLIRQPGTSEITTNNQFYTDSRIEFAEK